MTWPSPLVSAGIAVVAAVVLIAVIVVAYRLRLRQSERAAGLVRCPACKERVWDGAERCASCGRPMPARRRR